MNRGPSYLDTLFALRLSSMGGGLVTAQSTGTIDWGDHVTLSADPNARKVRIEALKGGIESVIGVSAVWFVDAANGGTQDGGLATPYNTIQAAITAACAADTPVATIMVAPGTYPEVLSVPATRPATLVLQGWSEGSALLSTSPSGGIYISELTPSAPKAIVFRGLAFATAYPVHTSSTTTVSAALTFEGCSGTIGVLADQIALTLLGSNLGGTVAANTGVIVSCDGVSWAKSIKGRGLTVTPLLNLVALGTLCDYQDSTLSSTGSQPGATVAVSVTHTGARAGDFAIGTLRGTPATDFSFSFHYATTNTLHFILHNLSRANGIFSESFRTCLVHMALPPSAV
jgi:hypothetical protein